MTKLVIQIPVYNEAPYLPAVLAGLPRQLPGVESVQVVVIDDGSIDDSAKVALENGADFVLQHRKNQGLSRSFISGIRFALALGADIIVNTDGDNQYPGSEIGLLIEPILSGRADLVIGDRKTLENENFSPLKRQLESVGSWFVRRVSATNVPDTASGFRAFSRYAALPLEVFNPFSYTLETLIQAGKSGMKIESVPVKTNPAQRASRLHKGLFDFIWHQGGAVIRSYMLYQPLRTFLSIGGVFFLAGAVLLLRFLIYFLFIGEASRYIQSVSIGGTLTLAGIILILIGFIGDAVRANRELSEEILVNMRDKNTVQPGPDLTEFEGLPVYSQEHPYPGL